MIPLSIRLKSSIFNVATRKCKSIICASHYILLDIGDSLDEKIKGEKQGV